ncbi:SAM-dependent methyltransferase [Cryptosporangium arvum]|uniref:Trans-aconitate methyltransferase n=1 Tax=Cryptosporangium arvum DSM 44712 TaxID=927661 RepID=A0A010YJ12_9ACTN|nr:SAM-dependent methyltransferase [Cryptosporangium arvum]EXG80215.1 trans-aconitate methyltransferase [Cryptosporangium arvum DSM 44712]
MEQHTASDVEPERPSAARVYDYYLGGSHNFAVDRAMAEQAIRILPELPGNMRANRAFLRRAVRYLIAQGVRQFLDLGSGIPTVGNVHEVALGEAPDCRVVYVDNDPVAVAHSQSILEDVRAATIVQADVTDPGAVLAEARRHLDFERPVGVLMVALLHFVPDSAAPASVIARYRDAVAPGSFLAISHGTADQQGDRGPAMEALYSRSANPLVSRDRATVESFFEGYELVDPGVVFVPLWRPEPGALPAATPPERTATYAGVGRLR